MIKKPLKEVSLGIDPTKRDDVYLRTSRIMVDTEATDPLEPTGNAKLDRLRQLERKLQDNKYYLTTLKCEQSLAQFTKTFWEVLEPGTTLLWNWHLDTICTYLETTSPWYVPKPGDKPRQTRLIINVPPGSMKSILVSVMYPAWLWTQDPGIKILGVSNSQDLAIRDARKTKMILESDDFKKRWPRFEFTGDQSAKTNYENKARGFRQSLGMTANITGKRGDVILIDDPSDANDVSSDIKLDTVNRIYDEKLNTRLNNQNHGVIILIMQRLAHHDLSGHLGRKTTRPWTKVVIPMHFDKAFTYTAALDLGPSFYRLEDPREDNELMFPELFDEDTVTSLEEDMGTFISAGQLEQRPSPKSGGILKEAWFRVLPEDDEIPVCNHVFTSWDTAYSTEEMKKSSFSVATTWGVWWNKYKERECLLLLDLWYGRVDYPELRRKAHDIDDDKKPDAHLVEKKASGLALIADLRQSGLHIRTVTPDKDKVTRAYSVQAMLESGLVWIPERKWAKYFAYQCSTFPTGEPLSEDIVDTTTQALLYLRNQWHVTHPDDVEHDPVEYNYASPYGEQDRVPEGLISDEDNFYDQLDGIDMTTLQ